MGGGLVVSMGGKGGSGVAGIGAMASGTGAAGGCAGFDVSVFFPDGGAIDFASGAGEGFLGTALSG